MNEIATAEQLLKNADETKEVEVDGVGTVVVRKLTAGDFCTMVDSESISDRVYMLNVERGLADPKLTREQIEKLPATTLLKLSQAVDSFNNSVDEKAEEGSFRDESDEAVSVSSGEGLGDEPS